MTADQPAPTRAKKAANPSPAQRRVLENLQAGRRIDHGISRKSAYGGLSGTILSLHRRGWVDGSGDISEAGKAALS